MRARVSDTRMTHADRWWARFLNGFSQKRTGMGGAGRLTKNGHLDLRGCDCEFCCRVSHLPVPYQ
ncbi:hypothetical protein COCSADRAFT_39313 [Bipolaris sorokiniana ND90Pr]|uniref:Uncharacterized protein n=1 Tax=Cochliobolus sativus (strain ND90Pr / ATCC 201652) TaxID=665912 RepID=M2R334_COCSN|nr:uncharacterized protein COCSADRAFT_39313 [Bipolaris sorokiniana ND90Pr]EMD61614.1 hypothetical protein COCSADRAFT_39313 [Bipolaris sorokiniana ND90Pr]